MKYKRALIRFLKSIYYVDKLFYLKNLSKSRRFSDDFVLIYTMGKVASTSIYESLKQRYPTKDIFHLHRLNPIYLQEREHLIRSEIFGNENYPRHLITDLLWKPQWISRIIKKESYKCLKLITIVREPVSRNISLFFQWIDFKETNDAYSFKSRNQNYPFDITTPKNDLSKLYNVFYNTFVNESHLEWITTEMQTVFNYNILEVSFNKHKGYSVIKKDKLHVLVLKLEQLNDNYSVSMQEFFGDDMKLILANEASGKPINKVYKDFKKNFKPPKDYIETLYASKYMNHFYTDLEIVNYKNKWLKT